MSTSVQNGTNHAAAQSRPKQPSNRSPASRFVTALPGDALAVVLLCGFVAVACGGRATVRGVDSGSEVATHDTGAGEPAFADLGGGDGTHDTSAGEPASADLGGGDATHDTGAGGPASADSGADVLGGTSEDAPRSSDVVGVPDAPAERGRDRGPAPSDVLGDASDVDGGADGGASDASGDAAKDLGGDGSTYACRSSTCSSSQYCVRSFAGNEVPPPACLPVPSDGVCPPGTQVGCQGGQAGCGEIPGSSFGACRASSCSDSTLCQCLCSSVGNGQCSREGQVITCFVP